MQKFNAQSVAQFLASRQFSAFEYQAPAMVAAHFGVCAITAKRWVNRVVNGGFICSNGRVAPAVAADTAAGAGVPRFIRRGKDFNWVHPLEIRPGDIDCTGMDDAEFEREVCRALGIFRFCPPRIGVAA
jgi:hypothetical protein